MQGVAYAVVVLRVRTAHFGNEGTVYYDNHKIAMTMVAGEANYKTEVKKTLSSLLEANMCEGAVYEFKMCIAGQAIDVEDDNYMRLWQVNDLVRGEVTWPVGAVPVAAARAIQCAWRCRCARFQFKKLQEELWEIEEAQVEEEIAMKIQRSWDELDRHREWEDEPYDEPYGERQV